MPAHENDSRILPAGVSSRIGGENSPIAPTVVDQELPLYMVDMSQESGAYVEDLFSNQTILGATVPSESQPVADVGLGTDDLDSLFGAQVIYQLTPTEQIHEPYVTTASSVPAVQHEPLTVPIDDDFDMRFGVHAFYEPPRRHVAATPDTSISVTEQISSLNTDQTDTGLYDSRSLSLHPDMQEAPTISLRDQMIQHMTNNVARVMQTYASALEAHMATCNGSDGHVFNGKQTSGETWIKAYEGTQAAIQQVFETDIEMKKAAEKGELSEEQEAKLQKLALKTYGDTLGTDTTKLQAMTSELYRLSDPRLAMSMMQGALSHVGCACHPTQMAGAAPTLFGGWGGLQQGKKEHHHKHDVILCKKCGWTGVQCESESCPRCRAKKQWVSGKANIKKFLQAAKHN